MSVYKHHVFVCLNERPQGHPRGCCKQRDSEKLHLSLKKEIASRQLQKDIRINKSGCLDQCESGPMIVIYPEATWYANVKPEDAKEIVDALLEGKQVEKLKYSKET
ncbi:MAG: (2Fe-2S) ferredoxin domain-containing protein [Bdellovibrionales bacterium]|nr:(2Fe-2S) ferredoxin domain-containing protein [Bdellovibrionales bacterium]